LSGIATSEIYDPTTGTWLVTGGMAHGRRSHAAALLANFKVLVAGGYGRSIEASAEVFDPTSGTWSPIADMPLRQAGDAAVLLSDGRVLIAGGEVAGRAALVFDPLSATWSGVGTLPSIHTYPRMTVIAGGLPLIAGGESASASMFDRSTGTWTALPAMSVSRSNHSLITLANGKVLAAGGRNASGPLASAELGDGFVETPPALRFEPLSLGFGGLPVGTSSPPRTLTIRNSGSANIQISGTTLTGGWASHFSFSSNGCSGTNLPAGGTCDMALVFAPTVPAIMSAMLEIASNASDGPQRVLVTGLGLGPRLSVSSFFRFADQLVGTQSAPQVAVIGNSGTTSTRITWVGTDGPDADQFQIVENPCSDRVLQPGDDCNARVAFLPTRTGIRSAVLGVFGDSGGGYQTAALTGSATGLVFAPDPVTFGDQTVGTRQSIWVRVHNTSTTPVRIDWVGIDGLDQEQFSFAASPGDDCLGKTLAPYQWCGDFVVFSPTTPGATQALFGIAGSHAYQTEHVTGTGIGPAISFGPNSIDFGSQPVGTGSPPRTATITNSGNANLHINWIGIDGVDDFVMMSTTCTNANLAPGATCSATLVLFPTVIGPRSAALGVTGDGSAGYRTVPLTGTGT
jgi:hypothetical protein